MPRQCAMGEQCVAPDGPEQLSMYNPDRVCRWCKNAKLTPEDAPTTEELFTDPEKCTSCGKPVVDLLDAWLCAECMAEARQRGTIWEPYAPKLKEPPLEERFGELFRAAQVLMKEGVNEDELFLTIAFAGLIVQGIADFKTEKEHLAAAWGKPSAWKREVRKFTVNHPGILPVKIVDGIPILEQESAFIEICNYPQTEVPQEVVIHIHPCRQKPALDKIVYTYKKVLSVVGLPYDVTDRFLPMSAEPFEECLLITVPNHKPEVPEEYAKTVWGHERPRFQHPSMVRAYCEMVLGSSWAGKEGFAAYLGVRGGGSPAAAEKLAPACVALYLREIGGIEGRKSIHRLLNENVYCGAYKNLKIPEDGSDKSRENAFWEPIEDPMHHNRVKRPLAAAQNTLLSQGK